MEKFLEALDKVKESFGSKIEELYRNLALKRLLLQEIKKKTQVISVKRIIEVEMRCFGYYKYKDELETVTILLVKDLEDKVIAIEHNLNMEPLSSGKIGRLAQIQLIEIPYTTKETEKGLEKVLERKRKEKPIIKVKFFPPSFGGQGHCLMDIYKPNGKKLIQELFGEVLVIQEEETEPAEIEKIKKKEDIEELEGDEIFTWPLDEQLFGDDRARIVRYKVL